MRVSEMVKVNPEIVKQFDEYLDTLCAGKEDPSLLAAACNAMIEFLSNVESSFGSIDSEMEMLETMELALGIYKLCRSKSDMINNAFSPSVDQNDERLKVIRYHIVAGTTDLIDLYNHTVVVLKILDKSGDTTSDKSEEN